MDEVHIGLNDAALTIIPNMASQLELTAIPIKAREFIIKDAYVSIELVNHSPSRQYIELWFFQAKEDTSYSTLQALDQDRINGFVGNLEYTTTRLQDGQMLWQQYRCIKKRYYEMEPNAIVKCGKRLATGKYDAQMINENEEYAKKWTEFMVIRAWSQIVRNTEETDQFVVDNSVLGVRVQRYFKVQKTLQPKATEPGAARILPTPFAPSVYSDVVLENT
jgi:hypothetical protein